MEWWRTGEFRKQQGFELLWGITAEDQSSGAGLRLHPPLGFSRFQLSNASPALTLLGCSCMQGGGLGFEEFFWELQPWQAKGCRTWGVWPFHRQRCCRKAFPELLAPVALLLLGTHQDPGDCTWSEQILRSLQLFTAGAFPASKQVSAWKSSGGEFMCSDNWRGQKRDVSSVGQGFFQMALWKEVLYDGFLWKCCVNSELFPAV